MARSKNSLLGKSHIHSEQQEEEKRTNNGPQIASMVMPRIINLRQELFGHPLAGIIYVQLHQVPILHTTTQIINCSVQMLVRKNSPHHHPNGKNGRKIH